MPIEPGEPAPAITAPNQLGDSVTLEFNGPTVLYFYPRDDTPGCTTEADQFQRELETYYDAGVAVYGVSTDDVDSHAAFASDRGLEFDLLADPDGEIADAFAVDLRSDGAASRTTFVLADGQVCGLYEGVQPDGHARTVLMDMLDMGLVNLE
jgi:peroxiredoxin Q/BCP